MGRAAITIRTCVDQSSRQSLATSPELPTGPDAVEFDALQENPARWIGVVAEFVARYASALAVPAGEGTVLVALLGRDLVLKLYPSFLRDHFEFERAMLGHLQGRISLRTPALVDSAEQDGWPYLVMTQRQGAGLASGHGGSCAAGVLERTWRG